MKKQTDSDDYAKRMQAVYDRSNEKQKLRDELTKIFSHRKFGHSLDVGPGPGLISDVLNRQSEKLTFVEITADYKSVLTKKFPDAEVIIDSINTISLNEKFDAILYSQGLFYQPEKDWLKVSRRLFDVLAPGGMLVIVMCSDSGDYWEIIEHVWGAKPELKAFYFKKWSEFMVELKTLGPLKTSTFNFDSYCKQSEIKDFIGGCMLAIMDRDLLEKNRSLIEDFCMHYATEGDDLKLSIDCGIAVVTKPS